MQAYTTEHPHSAPAVLPHHPVSSPYERLKAAIAEAHPATAEHSIRVRIWATRLGSICGLSGQQLTSLSIAAEVHDIGKLRIPHAILDKPTQLSNCDWMIIRQHPLWGAKMVASAFPARPDVARCVLTHHERLDGSGYPYGLAGRDIPLLSRIVSVADAFVALTENRCHRPAMDPVRALKVMAEEESGKYDADLLDTLNKLV